MFRLKKLWVENYKNLQNLTIDFEAGDGFSMLIGNNGSGKSNVLEVISGIFYAVYTKNVRKIRSEYSLEYALDDNIMKIGYKNSKFYYKANNISKTKENFIRDEMFPKEIVAVYSGEEARLWTNFYRPFTQIYTRKIINSNTYAGNRKLTFISKAYWEISLLTMLLSQRDDIKSFLKDVLKIEKIEGIFLNLNPYATNRTKNPILKAFIESLYLKTDLPDVDYEEYDLNYTLPWLKRKLANYYNDEKQLFTLFADAYLPKNNSLINDIGIFFNDALELSSLSEGEKKLILIKAVCEFFSNEKSLLLFDEPDAHINEAKKSSMYYLMQNYKQPQIIMTTHSPTLTKIAKSNEKLVLQKDNAGHALIVPCSDIEALEKISDGLWTSNAESIIFISQKPLILIEGSSDITCIQGAINIFLQRYKKYVDIDCEYLPMGGASNAHEFISQLKPCIASNRKVIVIFDRDEAGGKGMDACIKKGKNRRDFSTYQEGSWFYFMLPKRVQHTQDDYLLEDCFSPHKVKDIALDIVQNISGEFKKYPKDLRETIKKRLAKEITNYSESDLEGFKILLDKIHNIITDQEQCIQVPLRRTT